MKRSFVLIAFLLSAAHGIALPLGNPAAAAQLCDGLIYEGNDHDSCLSFCQALSVRMGFYGDYVFNRHLKEEESGSDFDEACLTTNAGLLVLNYRDQIDLFATFGATSFFAETGLLEMQTRTCFSWSVGAVATFWRYGRLQFGAEGQYTHADLKVMRTSVGSSLSNYAQNYEYSYSEGQAGLGVACSLYFFSPYLGVKWATAKLDPNIEAITIGGNVVPLDTLVSQKLWGFVVGLSLIDCNKIELTAEGRWFDEKALHINGQIRF